MIARAEFIAAVRSCIGTPVVHGGREIGVALDCVGLPWAAANACGADLPPTLRYVAWPTGDELTTGLQAFCVPCAVEDAHLWQVYSGKQPRHVVVPVGGDRVVHAWGRGRRKRTGVSKVVEVPLHDRVAAGWRIRGIE